MLHKLLWLQGTQNYINTHVKLTIHMYEHVVTCDNNQ
jgi:hypothetical protein